MPPSSDKIVASLSVSLLLLSLAHLASCARILGVFPHIGKSHFDVFEPLMKTLAERGHEVSVLSHFPLSNPPANYTNLSVKGSFVGFSPTGQVKMNESYGESGLMNSVKLSQIGVASCELVLSHPNAQRLIHSKEKFDLIITELFNTDCFLGFVHKFQAPHVALSSCVLMPWSNHRFANPDNPSYIPVVFHHFSDKMSFTERLMNAFYYIMQHVLYDVLYDNPSQKIARKYFGESLPPLQEIARNTSMLLVNSHFSLNRPRPLVPAIVEVGGIHIPPLQRLPQDLQKFLDEAKEGVIYFNMGSMIRAASFHEDKRTAFMEAFSELPFKVLWKWEEPMPGQPSNVKISSWLPQNDILNHPNVKLFIGHGGLLGTIEAASAGVPMIGIPVFGDQRANVRNIVSIGMAVHLEYNTINKQSVLRTVNEVLENPSYRETAKKISQAYKDRPVKPMDEAVFWVEYVIRHRGADLMRTAANELNLFQYLLLDVISVALLGVFLIILVVYLALSKLKSYANIVAKLKSH
ncbi:UDP-glycosyltransferase UGT5 [Anabrus simplex]|uniref:UDP-glycosyltransferase UGT5 n=1 Tax=Anabrus simplex TaxID=316456 RepID=UPI0035A3471E